MYAGSHRRSFPFFLDVVAAISDEGPSIAVCHHVGPKVAAIDPGDLGRRPNDIAPRRAHAPRAIASAAGIFIGRRWPRTAPSCGA